MPLGREVDLGTGDIVLDADPAPPATGTAPPIFGPCLLGSGRKTDLPRGTSTDVVWCEPLQVFSLPVGGSDGRA